jgi:Tol biopolymer transport system component
VISPDGLVMAYASDRGDRSVSRLYAEPFGGGDARPLTPAGARQRCVRFSRDGRSLVYIEMDSAAVRRVPLAGGAPETLAEGALCVDDCGAAGLLLVRGGAPDCPTCERLVLLAGGAEREVLRMRGRMILYPRCDARGERVAFAARNLTGTDLILADLASGGRRTLLEKVSKLSDPVFAADGKTILYSALVAGRLNVFEVPVEGGVPRPVTTGAGPHRNPAPTPDGKGLLFLLDDEAVRLHAIDLKTGARRRVSSRLDEIMAFNVTFALDGRAVFVQMLHAAGDVVAELALDGSAPRMLAAGRHPSPTPDDREILFAASAAAGRFRIEAVRREGGPARLIVEGEGDVRELVAGLDGRVHLDIERGDRRLALAAPLSGGEAVLEAPEPWEHIVPMAGGHLRAVRAEGYYGVDYILPPGVPPAAGPVDPRAMRIRDFAMTFSRDFKSAVYADGRRVLSFTPATGEQRVLHEYGMPSELALSPDGGTLLLGEFAGGVRRQLVMNFGDRPR